METYRGPFDQLPRLSGRRAITLGTFDGVHRGHQAILEQLLRRGAEPGLAGAAVVTFGQHPRAVLTPGARPAILTTEEEKLRLFAAMGVPLTVILEFNERLAQLPYDAFVVNVLCQRLGLAQFVLGHEVHFGHGRGGNFATVATLADAVGFAVSQVASVRHDGAPVSSSRIRAVIADGRVGEAAAMMGHPYPLSGKVIAGRGQGRQLGFPTANVELPRQDKLLPPAGVYACWARALPPAPPAAAETPALRQHPLATRAAWREGVLNLGRAPTVTAGSELALEVHLLDGDHSLYGQVLEIALGARIREEFRFSSVEELVARIGADVVEARQRLHEAPPWARPESLDRLGGDPA